ncbi:MAG: hypothetical protein PHU27_10770, partial [Salinivirgaceae bacterium]|nr:hypothetical protein [Salinivirgaceae bacterium]
MKRFHSILITFCAITMFTTNSYAQTDFNVGMEYYRNKEYAKAAATFKLLVQQRPSETYLIYYINSLLEQKEYDEATDAIKTYGRKLLNNPSFKVQIGQFYKIMGNDREADKLFRDAISKGTNDRNSAISVANRFISQRQFEMAERVYIEASKKIKGASFDQELANIYYYMRNYPAMVNIYLNLLAQSEAFLQMVQNRLYSAIYSDTDKSLIKVLEDQLLFKIQDYPEASVFNELLIWVYLQQNNFSQAFIQARALDLRNNEQGQRILPLAQNAAKENDFETALKAYNYLTELGENSTLFMVAFREKLDLLYSKLKLGIDFSPEVIEETISTYNQAIEKYGYKVEMLQTILNYIELLTYYSNKPDEALVIIDKAAAIRGVNKFDLAKIELLRADVMIFEDKIWDAALIYAKIERQNSENPVGFEAKYRKAYMAFYQHEFEWAKSQLDVLKGATSKAISNNAIEVSILLYEGWSEDDSTQLPLRLYATALQQTAQRKYESAFKTIDSLIATEHSYLSVEALNLKAKILISTSKFQEAATTYEQVRTKFSSETNIDRST